MPDNPLLNDAKHQRAIQIRHIRTGKINFPHRHFPSPLLLAKEENVDARYHTHPDGRVAKKTFLTSTNPSMSAGYGPVDFGRNIYIAKSPALLVSFDTYSIIFENLWMALDTLGALKHGLQDNGAIPAPCNSRGSV